MQNMFSDVSGGGAQGGGAQGQGEDVPFWMKYAGKGAGVVGGCVAIFFGIWCAVSIYPTCIVAGIWQILAGLVVILVEAPFCSKFVPQIAKFSTIVESRPTWQRGLVYLAISLPPMMLCAGLSTIVGSGLIFTTAVIYGMMTVGKKASRDEMAAAAASSAAQSNAASNNGAFSTSSSSVKSDGIKSGLVGNIHGQDVEAARQASNT